MYAQGYPKDLYRAGRYDTEAAKDRCSSRMVAGGWRACPTASELAEETHVQAFGSHSERHEQNLTISFLLPLFHLLYKANAEVALAIKSMEKYY